MKISTRDAYGQILEKLGSDQRIVVLDADLSKATKTCKFSKKYPERFFNCGIAEANMMGVAAGLATCGKIVFVSSFAMFAAERAFEQIRNSICYPNLNVKICATHAGITVGEDGATHQAIEDLALMQSLPNMTVFCPSDFTQTQQALSEAIKINGPVYIRLSKHQVEQIFDPKHEFDGAHINPIKYGNNALVISTGIMTQIVKKADEILDESEISICHININRLKPINKKTLISYAKRFSIIITIEEHSIVGGLGEAVSRAISEELAVRIIRIGMPDCFGKSGKPKDLLRRFFLDSESIAKKIKNVVLIQKLTEV